jgi:uncharacterized protein YndB with AHSA1/START domain
MLLTALDSAYFAFARRRRTIDLRSSCTCAACAQIESLDLKLIAHHGEYMEHVVAGRPELVGNDVILVHRLLKNHVAKDTGVKAFALLTDSCCQALTLDPQRLELQPHREPYDDVGEVEGWVRDLGARWEAASEREQVRVSVEDADFTFSKICAGPAPEVWDALVAPEKVLEWKGGGATDVQMENPSGGRGVGSVTHCVHGKQAFDQEILDWRPFSYFSYQESGPYGPFLYTFELADEGGQTALDVRVQLVGGRRQRMMMRLASRKFRGIIGESLEKLGSIVESDESGSAT